MVDADAVLAHAFSAKRFQMISWRRLQVPQHDRRQRQHQI
jgi:hypothetical protein